MIQLDGKMASSVFQKKQRQLRFNNIVLVGETWSKHDYCREAYSPIPPTPLLALIIERELDELKAEMETFYQWNKQAFDTIHFES